MGVKIIIKDTCAGSFSEIEKNRDIEKEISNSSFLQTEKTIMRKDDEFNVLHATDYLRFIKPHFSKELLSIENFKDIKDLADHLTGGITSFFGFEYKLNSSNGNPDYLIAVSSQKGEREALSSLIKNKLLPDKFLSRHEWQNIGNFAETWSDPDSVLYDNVFGLWLEFDEPDIISENIIPSIFLQIKPLYINKPTDIEKCTWVTQTAIPLLNGKKVSEKLEQNFLECLRKLPKGASVFHIASMLSRQNEDGIRIVIKRIDPDQIIPYLNAIGWFDEKTGLSDLLNEIKKYSNCIRLHINISETIDKKIGLECFISPDRYQKDADWSQFMEYLVRKDLCKPDLRSALLNFPGVEQENPEYDFDLESYMPSVKLPDKNFSKAIVRYISHIKISYEPKMPIEAKAYTGIRLFGLMEE